MEETYTLYVDDDISGEPLHKLSDAIQMGEQYVSTGRQLRIESSGPGGISGRQIWNYDPKTKTWIKLVL